MMVNKALVVAAVLLFTAPLAPALAHDGPGYGYGNGYNAGPLPPRRDFGDQYRRPPEGGFHQDHPGNWHDNGGWRGGYGGWRYGWPHGWWPHGWWRYGGWHHDR